VVPTLDPIDPVDVTGISVAQTQNSVDTDNVDTSNDEGVRQDRHKVVTLEDTEHFIKDNMNKMKCYN
jgi:low affinity Fe/Cu permease